MRQIISVIAITATIVASAIVGGHAAQAAPPPPPPQFFQDTGLLTTPFPVCGNGGDGYSNAHCPVGGSFGSDHNPGAR